MTRKYCEHHISKTNEGNFTQFWWQLYVGSQMCCLDFGVKRSKVKVITGNDLKTMWTLYLKNQWREFHPILVTDVYGFVDAYVLIRFWVRKVKVTTDNYPKTLWTSYHKYKWREFHPFWSQMYLGSWMCWLDFGVERSMSTPAMIRKPCEHYISTSA